LYEFLITDITIIFILIEDFYGEIRSKYIHKEVARKLKPIIRDVQRAFASKKLKALRMPNLLAYKYLKDHQ